MTDLVYHAEVEREILSSGEWRDTLQGLGDRVAVDARRTAPAGHPSRGSAATIHAETTLEPAGWEARVSWERDKYWIGFSETGTVHMRARPFLRPALDRVRGSV